MVRNSNFLQVFSILTRIFLKLFPLNSLQFTHTEHNEAQTLHSPRHIILFQSKPQTTFRVILMAKTLIVSGWIYFSVYLQFWLTVIGYIFHAKQEFHWVSANPLVIQYLNPAKTHWEAIASIINNFLKLTFLCQLKYVLKDPSGYFSQTIY